MSQGPHPSHNPLNAAASQVMHAAKECKSPVLEKLAIVAMVSSALVSTGLGAVQVMRMISHDKEKAEEKAYQRIRREHETEGHAGRPYAAHGHRR